MAYATQNDIVELYSERALYVADRDGDGVPDSDAVAKALRLAAGEMNSYLAVRYDVPIDPTNDILMQLNVDVALYRLASHADVLTDELRTRYDDAIELLKRLSAGTAALPPAPVDPDADDDDGALDGPRPIVAGGPPRLFSRAQMRDL